MKKTVLITGAGGLIGSILRNTLSDTYTVRSLSLDPIPGVKAIVADIADMEAMVVACQDVDSVIHLAATGSHFAPWEPVLQNNIIGVYSIFEAAYQAGVKQMIFASSNHAVGGYDLENAPAIYHTGLPQVDSLQPVRPDSLYGVSKAFGEALGRYYADQCGMRVICLRIGMVNQWDCPPLYDSPYYKAARLASIWLSQRDLTQLVEKSLRAEHVKFDIFYGISNNPQHFYDIEHGRQELGYEPQDRSDERLALLQRQSESSS